jgi:hypothetical protein
MSILTKYIVVSKDHLHKKGTRTLNKMANIDACSTKKRKLSKTLISFLYKNRITEVEKLGNGKTASAFKDY